MENDNLENEVSQQTETPVENQESHTNDSPDNIPDNEVVENVPQAPGNVSQGENNQNSSSVSNSEPDNGFDGDSEPDNGSEGDSELDNGSDGDSESDNGSDGDSEPDNGSDGDSEPDNGSDGDSEPDNSSEGDSEPDNGSDGDSEPDIGFEGDSEPDNGSDGDSEPDNGSEGDSEPDNGSEGDSEPDNGSEGDSEPDNGSESDLGTGDDLDGLGGVSLFSGQVLDEKFLNIEPFLESIDVKVDELLTEIKESRSFNLWESKLSELSSTDTLLLMIFIVLFVQFIHNLFKGSRWFRG